MRTSVISLGIVCSLSVPAFGQTSLEDSASIENDGAPAALDISTREQRLAVQPLDWDETRGEGLRTEAPETVEPDALGSLEAGATGSGRPDPNSDAEAQALFPEDWRGLEEGNRMEVLDGASGDVGTLGTKDVFTQYCENCGPLHKQWPQRTIGKLFSNAGSCTASVVSPNNVIVTAAHCCYNRSQGDWVRGWSFAPAYRDGFAPYGTFGWSRAQIVPRWISHGDRQSDVCVIKLRNNAQNKPVTHYTGWLGRAWNRGTKQVHHALGYPGNIGSGNKQELCVSESFNPSSGCGGSSVLNTGCSMTYGASGGPWVLGYRGGANQVNSVVSGYDGSSCTGSFGKTFNGPRFTDDNIKLVCDRIGC